MKLIWINDEFLVLIADRPRIFFQIQLMITATKKIYLEAKVERRQQGKKRMKHREARLKTGPADSIEIEAQAKVDH